MEQFSYISYFQLGSQCNQDSGILGPGSTFFVREIFDGIVAKPAGQSRQVFHAAPWGASDPKTCCNDNF